MASEEDDCAAAHASMMPVEEEEFDLSDIMEEDIGEEESRRAALAKAADEALEVPEEKEDDMVRLGWMKTKPVSFLNLICLFCSSASYSSSSSILLSCILGGQAAPGGGGNCQVEQEEQQEEEEGQKEEGQQEARRAVSRQCSDRYYDSCIVVLRDYRFYYVSRLASIKGTKKKMHNNNMEKKEIEWSH